ncbi:uncharacterized protein LOC128737822 [Sabethes cyaneus]|uniref:uncharacterized protein LOC128737822 n=1 Tax=Sabethes cyaneus TaxID=53552 RepID=UPI00237E1257|nr:uncharacterized protein LOC128737822 [Sabethes cyaneus]
MNSQLSVQLFKMAHLSRWIVVAVLVIATGEITRCTPTGTSADRKQKYNEFKRTCAKILRTPADELEQYMNSKYSENHDTFCFIRCTSILDGAYDDATGVNLSRMYESMGEGLTEEQFTEQAKSCSEPVEGEPEETCYCRKAWKQLWCVRKQYLDRKKAHEEATEA